jgi:phage-related protein
VVSSSSKGLLVRTGGTQTDAQAPRKRRGTVSTELNDYITIDILSRVKPLDRKPMTSIGPGVQEIRVREEGGAFRVI